MNPQYQISKQSMGLNSIRIMFELHNYAWALAGGAHLHRLRAYSLKFMSCLTQRLDAESGLRPPSILEAQSADKQLWHHIQDLCVDQGASMMHFMNLQFKDQICLLCCNLVWRCRNLQHLLFTMTPKASKVVARIRKVRRVNLLRSLVLDGYPRFGSKGSTNLFACDFRATLAIWLPTASLCTSALCPNPMARRVEVITVPKIMTKHLTDPWFLLRVSQMQLQIFPIWMNLQIALSCSRI